MKRLLLILFALAMCLSSCKTFRKIEYRDRDVVRYVTQVVHDTLRESSTDSVYVSVIQKGDTVFLTKYKERIRWRDRYYELHDTCWRDSIVTKYLETTVEVKYIPKFFWICFVLSSIIITFALAKLVFYIKSKWL